VSKSIVRKAVIPAAGFGTRLLPATKAQPKEMLPVVDRPVIQYVIEEAGMAGLEDILIITGKGKHALEDHFDRNFELEEELRKSGKADALKQIRELSRAKLHYIRQTELRGLGDAVNHARYHVAGEAFAVLLGDTLLRPSGSCLKKLVEIHERTGDAVLAVEEVPYEKVERYGILQVEPAEYEGEFVVKSIVEKPKKQEAPSRLAAAGRYVLVPEVFDILDDTPVGKNGELQLTDALQVLAKNGHLRAYQFEGKRYDVGDKVDYVLTTVEFALDRPDMKGLRQSLEKLLKNGE
jgi:UTP--glucose-1-phosphate uridylyltransferase